MYRTVKGLIPKRLRKTFRPVYARLALRGFDRPQSVEIKTYGFSIQLEPNNGEVDEYIYMHRNWETTIAAILEQKLERGGTFIDIGANIGYFSLEAATLVGEGGRVIAFEPLPFLAEQLRTSIQLNGFSNIDVRQLALGDSVGEQKIELQRGNIGGSSLVKELDSGHFETVKVARLDDELAGIDRVDLIKIDVEGYEYEVLKGAQAVLQKHQPTLVMEFSPNVYRRRDPNMARDILLLLVNAGYSLTDIDRNIAVTDVDEFLAGLGTEQTNLLAVSKSG